jgi:RimJ/RimL family protein N-acetyltransferase
MDLISKTIYFRLAELSDASFILSLRVNENYNRYLSKVENNLEKQEKWLSEYKIREDKKLEYYFIIHRIIDSLPIGTVRIYDFLDNRESFCWGSWILNENKTRYAALESAILIYDFAFFELGFKRCHMDIRKGNKKVINFHKRFGVEIVGQSEVDYFAYYYPFKYLNIRESIINLIFENTNY